MMLGLARQACLALAAALVLPWPAPAQATAPAPQTESGPARGFLWDARRGEQRVLLLGAIHVGRPEFAAFRAADLPHLMQAEVVAFEANIFNAQATTAAVRRWAQYPEGGPGLEAHVDAATLARIERVIERGGGNLSVCCRLKPWMIANTMVVLEAIRAGFNPAYGSEALLYQFAISSGKPIVEIEGVDEQLRLFDEAAVGVQIDYLLSALEAAETGASRAEIERLVGAWERGDADAMQRLVDEMTRSNRPAQRFVAERIIHGRHPKMLEAIERYAASDRLHLVAIGALHYFGAGGLLQSLRERGFSLRRMP